MLGRLRRQSISSLEQLELERCPPKLIKHDPLSIYESTLMKLKEGSKHCQDIPPEETTSKGNINVESCCSSCDCSHNSSILEPSGEIKNGNISVVDLFSKYTTLRNNSVLPDKGAMAKDNACSPE